MFKPSRLDTVKLNIFKKLFTNIEKELIAKEFVELKLAQTQFNDKINVILLRQDAARPKLLHNIILEWFLHDCEPVDEIAIKMSALQLQFIEDCWKDVIQQNESGKLEMEVCVYPTYQLLYYVKQGDKRLVPLLKDLAYQQHERKILSDHCCLLSKSQITVLNAKLKNMRTIDLKLLRSIRLKQLPAVLDVQEQDSVPLKLFKQMLHFLARDWDQQKTAQQMQDNMRMLQYALTLGEALDQLVSKIVKPHKQIDELLLARLLPYVLYEFCQNKKPLLDESVVIALDVNELQNLRLNANEVAKWNMNRAGRKQIRIHPTYEVLLLIVNSGNTSILNFEEKLATLLSDLQRQQKKAPGRDLKMDTKSLEYQQGLVNMKVQRLLQPEIYQVDGFSMKFKLLSYCLQILNGENQFLRLRVKNMADQLGFARLAKALCEPKEEEVQMQLKAAIRSYADDEEIIEKKSIIYKETRVPCSYRFLVLLSLENILPKVVNEEANRLLEANIEVEAPPVDDISAIGIVRPDSTTKKLGFSPSKKKSQTKVIRRDSEEGSEKLIEPSQ